MISSPKVSSGIKLLAFIGYLSHGFIYLLLGGFALLVALGHSSGAATNQKGVVRRLLEQPFGEVFLWILAVGIFCYSIWRVIQSLTDYDDRGKSFKGIMLRIGYLISGTLYAFLGVYIIELIFSIAKESAPEAEKTFAHTLLTQPFGQALTFALGTGIIIFGVFQVIKAYKENFVKDLGIPANKKKYMVPICKLGLVSRGLVFVMIGSFFLQAAFKHDSAEAGGIKEAWRVLRAQPYGDAMLGIVALGFIAFAIFAFTRARFRLIT